MFHILKIQLCSNNVTLNLSNLTAEVHRGFSEIPYIHNATSASKALLNIMLFQ